MNFSTVAAVRLDDSPHPLEVAREQRAEGLRIDGLAHRRRASDVAEDDRYRLPLLTLRLAERSGAARAEPELAPKLLPARGTALGPVASAHLALPRHDDTALLVPRRRLGDGA